MDIKDKLRLTNRSWAGDPCLPEDYPWDALTCNEAPNRRIITLDLSGSGLNGEIPASIANLNELTSLNLSNNQLTGPIPESFAHLTKLKSLDLSRNNLTGLVPSTLIDKNDSGVLLLSIFQNPSLLRPNSSEPTPKKSKKNMFIVVISVSATIVLLFAFAFVLIMKTRKINDKNRNSVSLNWEQRLRVALSVAQGLEYLHCGCEPPIIHRDIKTVNILLNEKLEAKVADFGLSRLGPTEDDTHIWTIAVGTPGYVDPEYNITNKLTDKSDVYSFGIVLLELISGQPAIILEEERLHIVHWVTPKIKTGDIVSVVDPRLQGEYDIN
ncbi:probable leucine-rich repeat receptor-like protein kinase At2g28990 [Amborella trichopoda]|nr:probable leucine-rich repeat receptor-like protein kinase At2g28990 [Amborella trichopoda]|eukprot:XP_020528675.1 probable leucine-rich repeat receptor-like protein kinase At2g28990 [Amborella trichopoda]